MISGKEIVTKNGRRLALRLSIKLLKHAEVIQTNVVSG